MSAKTSSSQPSSSPVPFISVNPRTNQFQVDPSAAKLLSSIKGRICPIIVAGLHRSGKSTLLNLLLPPSATQLTQGFAVGSTINPVTKGIWLWGKPIHIQETNKTILFLDSEGLGSIGQQQTFDVQIFSLSILLSSLFILNTTGTINEAALEQLELVVQMTQRVRVNEKKKTTTTPANGDMDDEQLLTSLSGHFPDFLWVLRDFSLQLEDAQGNPITARQYLEQALQPVSAASTASIAEKNRIRHVISTVFPHRDCIPLVRPVVDERQLQRLSQLPSTALRPEFMQKIERLRERIYAQVKEKQIEGTYVTGPAYLQLTQSYIQALNTGSIPVIHSAWQNVLEIQDRQAMDLAMEDYDRQVKQLEQTITSTTPLSSTPQTMTQLESVLQSMQIHAIQMLQEHAIGDSQRLQALTKKVTQYILEREERVKGLYGRRIHDYHTQVLDKIWQEIHGDRLLLDINNHTEWLHLRTMMGDKYHQRIAALGGENTEVYTSQMSKLQERILQTVFDQKTKQQQALTHTQQELSATQQQLSDAKMQLVRMQEKLMHAENRSKESQQQSTEQQQRLHTQVDTLTQQVTQFQRQLQQAESQHQYQQQQWVQQVTELQGEVQNKTAELSNKNKTVFQLQHQIQQQQQQQQQPNVGLDTTRIVSLQQQLKKMEQERQISMEKSREDGEQLMKLQSMFEQQQQQQQVASAAGNGDGVAEKKTSRARKTVDQKQQNQPEYVEDDGIEMDDNELRAAGEDIDHQAGAAASSFSASRLSRPSLGPRSSAGGAPTDPHSLTIQQLKSWLTELDVQLPVAAKPKQFYIDEIYKALPELQSYYSKQETSSTTTKKGKKQPS